MGDPLSVAGTAVGIISLGLTVCNTIVSYRCAYRAFDEDIENLKSKAESLGENLEILKGAIEYTRTAEPETAIVLSNKIIRIKRFLVRLDGKIKQYGRSVSPESLARKTFKRRHILFGKMTFETWLQTWTVCKMTFRRRSQCMSELRLIRLVQY